MKLITEHMGQVEYITEDEGNKKQQYIKGVFLQADVKNENGRVYPFSVLRREVKKYNKTFIKENRALGELGHPMGPTINLDRVSHLITELVEDGTNFIGKAKVMDTPNGKIVKHLLESGVRLGVSSRGLGTVKLNKRKGVNEVQKDFILSTVDVVADPSAPDAFVNGIMEGKEFTADGKLEYEVQTEIRKAQLQELEAKKLQMFQKFLGNL